MNKPPKCKTHCFAPGCTGGYVSARKKGKKASIFTVPEDDERFKAWQRNIPRADKPLEKTSVLCELPFEPNFIMRDYTHVMNGEVVRIPRGRQCLSDDAVPSIFPNTPRYLSKKLPQKHQSRTSRGEVLGEKRKTRARNVTVLWGNTTASAMQQQTTQCHTTHVPWRNWTVCTTRSFPPGIGSRNGVPNTPKVVAFRICAQAGDSVRFRKLVLCSAGNTHYHSSVFVQCVCLKKEDLTDVESVEMLLHSVEHMNACCGFEKSLLQENDQKLTQAKHKVHGNSVHSKICPRVSLNERACIQCRYLRKLLLNQASYKRRKARGTAAFSTEKKLVKRDQQLRHAKAKVSSLKRILTRMKDENAAISSSEVEEKLSGLPQKQQQQVRACFNASSRKGTQGPSRPYSEDWILECILMRLKSPKLYEHISKYKIMVLPSKSCLLKYMRIYKSSFCLLLMCLLHFRRKRKLWMNLKNMGESLETRCFQRT